MHMIIILKTYTEKEINDIIYDYKNGMKPFELSKKYNRSSGSIINKLKSLSIYINTTNRYSKEDIDKIASFYSIGDWDSIFELYPNFKKSSIVSLMSENKISHSSRWNSHDSEIIKNFYFTKSIDEIIKMLNTKRTKSAIETYAAKKFNYFKNTKWTENEIHILKNNYSKVDSNEIQKMLPNRTFNAIKSKAKDLKLTSYFNLNTYWNERDVQFLISNWNEMSDVEIGLAINKTSSSVKDKRHLLGLYRQDKNNPKSYPDINKFLRGQLSSWKEESMKNCSYKCVITGSKNFQIHHIINMSKIIKEFLIEFPEYNIDYKDCDVDLLRKISKDFITFHNNNYPLGICLDVEIHKLFHSIYGKTNNTQRQMDEFICNYKKGIYVA